MYLALGLTITAPTFVLAGEGVRRVIVRMLSAPRDVLSAERARRELART